MNTLQLPFFPTIEFTEVKRRIYHARYYLWHKDKLIEGMYKYRATHKEQYNEYHRNYHRRLMTEIANRQKASKSVRDFQRRNAQKIRQYQKEWLRKHPEFIKKQYARRRGLGFIAVNNTFEGADAHHIDKVHVAYIPEQLHLSISHNVWTGCNMEKINAKVFEWLEKTSQTPKLFTLIENQRGR